MNDSSIKEFTMAEFIKANSLDVSPHDPAATRLIRAKLKEMGYFARRAKRHGKWEIVWSDTDRSAVLSQLSEKLGKL